MYLISELLRAYRVMEALRVLMTVAGREVVQPLASTLKATAILAFDRVANSVASPPLASSRNASCGR